jgi:DNA-binding CsgD family transcriptional regulator
MSGGRTLLLERSIELERIGDALDLANDGTGSVVLVEGEAGIGKTELLRAARQAASAAGITVLSARASELERDYAFGVVRQLLQSPIAEMGGDERARALSGAAALAGSLLDADEASEGRSVDKDLFALLHGLHWLCANLAVTQPLLLAADDVQWADHQSLRFLHFLAARIEEIPVVVVAALRTGEPDAPTELLDRLRAADATQAIRPSALSLDAAVSMLRDRLGADAEPEFCSACHEATRGNPLLLSELVRAVALEELAPTAASAGRVAELGARGLAERLDSRIRRLSPEAVDVARAIAVLEPHATLGHVASVAGVEGRATTRAAHALVDAGVLRDGSPLAFAHPLLRNSVAEQMTEPQRRELHASAARTHHAEGGDPGVIAVHLVRTDLVDERWAIDELRAAARQALSRAAPEPAIAFLRRALDQPAVPELRTDLMRELGTALLRAEDEEGIDWLLKSRAASPDPLFRAGIAEEVGPSLMIRGRMDEAIAVTRESITELDGANENARLLLLAAIVRTIAGGNEDALGEPYDELREAARGIQGPASIEERMALQFLALGGALGRESADEARSQARLALDDDDAVSAAAAFGRPLNLAAIALAMCGDTEHALHATELVVAQMRRRASGFGLATSLANQANVRLARGDVAGAEMDVDDALNVAGPALPMVRLGLTGLRIEILRMRGDIREAGRVLRAEGLTGDLPAAMFIGMLRVARGRLRLVEGRAHEALADLVAAAESYRGVGVFGPDLLPSRLQIALALDAVGRDADAKARARVEEEWARVFGNPRLIAEALRVRGLVDHRAGLDALTEAVELIATTEFRLDHARSLVDLGAALRRANSRKAAREPLRDGMEIAHACGATALEQRARVELEATGARPRSVIVTGADSLTPSERRVAQLAAEGMTNREIAQRLFVTTKTVETHLRHCYQKLDISGRSGLEEAMS